MIFSAKWPANAGFCPAKARWQVPKALAGNCSAISSSPAGEKAWKLKTKGEKNVFTR